jgi:hypothetical protein
MIPTPYISQIDAVPMSFGSAYEFPGNAIGNQITPAVIARLKKMNASVIAMKFIRSSVSRFGNFL